MIDFGRRAGVIQRDAHRPDQADGCVQSQVAGAVETDDGDPFSRPDAEGGQRPGSRQDLTPYFAGAARDQLPLHDVEVVHRPGLAPQAGEELLVDGAFRAVHKALVDGIREQAGQELAPVQRVGTQQPVDVVPLELFAFIEIGQEGEQAVEFRPEGFPPGLSVDLGMVRRSSIRPVPLLGQRQPDEHRPGQAQPEVLARPVSHEFHQLARPGQRLGRRGQVEVQPFRLRAEGQAYDGFGHVVHRDDVDRQRRVRRDHAAASRSGTAAAGSRRC